MTRPNIIAITGDMVSGEYANKHKNPIAFYSDSLQSLNSNFSIERNHHSDY